MAHQQKRLTLISQYFYPEMISTGHILTELVVELAKKGIKTSVLCAQHTYYSNHKMDKDITYSWKREAQEILELLQVAGNCHLSKNVKKH